MTRVLALSLLLSACSPSEATVRAAIQKARACTTSAECVDVGSRCPIGCTIAVNVSQADEIRVLLRKHESGCEYKCPSDASIACEEGLCTTKFRPQP